MDAVRVRSMNRPYETSGYPPGGTFTNPLSTAPLYHFGRNPSYAPDFLPTPQLPGTSHVFGQPQGTNMASSFMTTAQPHRHPLNTASLPLVSPDEVQSRLRMQVQEQKDWIAQAMKRIQDVEGQLRLQIQSATHWEAKANGLQWHLDAANHSAISWQRQARRFEALANEGASKLVLATKLFQGEDNLFNDETGILSSQKVTGITISGVVDPCREPQRANIMARSKSPRAADKPIIDLTRGDDFGAASDSPVPSDSVMVKSSSQSSNPGSFSVGKAAEKDYTWLAGGNPLRSPTLPRPYGPGQFDEQPDNTPQFGSYLSTANGRRTYSELIPRRGRPAKKKERLIKSPKPKAASISKAPPKPPRAAKQRKIKVTSSTEVKDGNRENEHTSIEPSQSRIQQTLSSTASIANPDIVVSSSTEVKDGDRENEHTSIEPSQSRIQQTLSSTASIANPDIVVSSSIANRNSVDDNADPDNIEDIASILVPAIFDGAQEEALYEMAAQMETDHDPLFDEDLDNIEDVASVLVPAIFDGAKEEDLYEMAAQMEADLEAMA